MKYIDVEEFIKVENERKYKVEITKENFELIKSKIHRTFYRFTENYINYGFLFFFVHKQCLHATRIEDDELTEVGIINGSKRATFNVEDGWKF